MTPLAAVNVNYANNESVGKHSLIGSGIDSPYTAISFKGSKVIAEHNDGIDELDSFVDSLDSASALQQCAPTLRGSDTD